MVVNEWLNEPEKKTDTPPRIYDSGVLWGDEKDSEEMEDIKRRERSREAGKGRNEDSRYVTVWWMEVNYTQTNTTPDFKTPSFGFVLVHLNNPPVSSTSKKTSNYQKDGPYHRKNDDNAMRRSLTRLIHSPSPPSPRGPFSLPHAPPLSWLLPPKNAPRSLSSLHPTPLSAENTIGVKNITRKVIKCLEGFGHLVTVDMDMSVA